MKKIFKNYWPQIILFMLSLFVIWPLLRNGYFSHQDDLQVIRIVEMKKCFTDFQIPCRWVPDMGWGNGYPLFNYYGVFTYYLGALISFFFNYLVTAKVLFGISLVLGSYGLYYFVQKLMNNKFSGFVASVLYLFAPYKALDVYVRGALGESMALAIIPFVFYFLLSIFDKTNKSRNFILFVLSLFLFLITHNIMTLVFLPLLLLFGLYLLVKDGYSSLRKLIMGFGISFMLSSFFLVPAFLEKDLVQTESLTRFELDYRANFVSIADLFLDREWGYGTSIPGPEGKMNFQVGTVHWIISFATAIILILLFLKKKFDVFGISVFVIFLASLFMMHNKSSFIWEKIKILEYFQFPWRFLSLSIFTSSILGGVLNDKISKKLQPIFVFVISLFALILNFGYFVPKQYYNITNQDKTSGELWEMQRKGALLDYLPKTALEPREPAPTEPLITAGEASISGFTVRSNSFEFVAKVSKQASVEVPIFYFPNWTVYVNGKEHEVSHNNYVGRIAIKLDPGEYQVHGKFMNTNIRILSNGLSLLGILFLVLFIKYEFKKQ